MISETAQGSIARLDKVAVGPPHEHRRQVAWVVTQLGLMKRTPSEWPGTARSSTSAGRSLMRTAGVTNDLPRPRVRDRGTRNARPVRRHAVNSHFSASGPGRRGPGKWPCG